MTYKKITQDVIEEVTTTTTQKKKEALETERINLLANKDVFMAEHDKKLVELDKMLALF